MNSILEKIKNLRKNRKGESVGFGEFFAIAFLGIILLVVVLALIPTLQTSVTSAQENVTDSAPDSMLGLIMILAVVAFAILPILAVVLNKLGFLTRGGT